MQVTNSKSDFPRHVYWKIVHLVANRPPSERNREGANQRAALARLTAGLSEIVDNCNLFLSAPFEHLAIVVGIDEAVPRPPTIDKLSRKSREIGVILEFDWREVRSFTSDDWFKRLGPVARDAVVDVLRKYRLPTECFLLAFEKWYSAERRNGK